MKLNKLIIFFVVMSCCFITNVFATASPIFYEDWDKFEEFPPRDLYEIPVMGNNFISYKDGYALSTFNVDGSSLIISDIQGEVLKSIERECLILNVLTDKEYIYTYSMYLENDETTGNSNYVGMLSKYDKDLKLVKEVVVEDFSTSIMEILFIFKMRSFNICKVENEKIYIFVESGILEYDFDLNFIKAIVSSEAISLYPEFNLQSIVGENNTLNGVDVKDDRIVISAKRKVECTLSDGTTGSCDEYYLRYFENEKMIFEKKDVEIFGVKLVGDYIVSNLFGDNGLELVIFDLEGNIVQRLNDSVYFGILGEGASFVSLKFDPDSDTCTSTVDSPKNIYPSTKDTYGSNNSLLKGFDISPVEDDVLKNKLFSNILCAKTSIVRYYLPLNITIKDNDNGTISVDKDVSKSGESVSITVQPKEGYKLDKVIVTDKNGKEVIFTDYTFTMPSSDVIVEAVFVVDNPNTSARNIIVLVLLITVSVLVFYKATRKYSWMN